MPFPPGPKQVYIETYGCQMNMADSELVGGILQREGYAFTKEIAEADVVLLNTCAIRENAEQRIFGRLGFVSTFKRRNPDLVVGILGCMAERLRARFVEQEKLVDIVVGPDEYRKLPSMMDMAFAGTRGIAVRLSRVENYEDIPPLRTEGISAWVSVMRGCDKFCSFCVVPFTRGRERSRTAVSIIHEVVELSRRGFKEVILLGQNVNSYRDETSDFADVLSNVAAVDRTIRVRFMTPHPQDMSDKLIETIASTDNICKHIHLPVQSGSNRILDLMNRTYTVEHYRRLVDRIRRTIPDVSLSTDIISGFPSETVDDHRLTVELIKETNYDGAYTFKYSPREHTKAWQLHDDVPEDVKGQRVNEITTLQHEISLNRNKKMIGTTETVLVEGLSKKSPEAFTGRTDTNKTVVFPKTDEQAGHYVKTLITGVNSATLFGERVAETATPVYTNVAMQREKTV